MLICYFSGFAALGKLLSLSMHQFSDLHRVAMMGLHMMVAYVMNGLRNSKLDI